MKTVDLQRVVKFAAIILIALLTVPGIGSSIGFGLDSSWMYALSVLPTSNYMFGRDVVFTYGPLGYLLCPIAVAGNTVARSMFFFALVHLITCFILWLYIRRSSRTYQITLFGVAYLVVCLIAPTTIEFRVGCFLALICCEACRRRSPLLLYSAASMGAMLLYVKTTLGLEAAILGGLTLFVRPGDWSSKAREGAVFGVIYVVGAALLARLLVPGFFWQWLHGSLDIAAGYSVAMSLVGSAVDLNCVLLLFFLLTATVVRLAAGRSALARPGVVFLGLAFLAVKHGVVREDLHIFIATCSLTTLVAFLLLAAEDVRDTGMCAALLAVCLSVHVGLAIEHRTVPTLKDMAQTCSLNLYRMFKPLQFEHELLAANDDLTGYDQIAKPMIETARRAGTCTILPYDISETYVYHLQWLPLPTLQQYIPCSPNLDELDARFFSGSDKPRAVLANIGATDGRHTFLASPCMWRALFSNYHVVDANDPLFVLLEPDERPRQAVFQQMAALDTMPEGWVDVPLSSNVVFAFMKPVLNLRGRMSNLFYRVPPLNLEFMASNGRKSEYRTVPQLLQDGVEVSCLPENQPQLAALFKGFDTFNNARLIKFRLTGPGTRYYRWPLHIDIKEQIFEP